MRGPFDPRGSEEDYRGPALAALAAGDWYGAYSYAKGWIVAGGGAWILDPWFLYAASALVHGQPRGAVHSLDLALGVWIEPIPDRGTLLWARGAIVRGRLADPKTALTDLCRAAEDAPRWLCTTAAADAEACLGEAELSRKRKPSVGAAPTYRGPGTTAETVARPRGPIVVGGRPAVWDAFVASLG
jgi:hypothetical protein